MNLIYLALFGIIILLTMSLVSNSGATAIGNIENEIFLMNCPFPIADQIATLQSIDGFQINYTISTFGNGTTYEGTDFNCYIDPITGAFTANTEIKEYGATLFSVIPYGYFGFILDWSTTLIDKIYHMATLVTFVMTPANFDVFGFTLEDLSGTALFVVVAIYLMAYLFIAVWVYSTIASMISGAMPT